ncbi:MAG: DUF692 domain-containing protein [Blastocatellia bacterium]|nr:DUF692 domain-containing protein [Blastocatellia bacterium]
MNDRLGLGWRPPLASGILTHQHRVDVIEIIADDYFDASRRELARLKTLAAQIPVVLHGVSLGMASAAPVDAKRLDRMARLVEAIEPEYWSEHLAFVRGGGTEIGHLAAPPRTAATIAGTLKNLETATAIVGSKPLVENIASLIDPPGSTLGEAEWVATILRESNCSMLFDLHNVYANAVNFGFEVQTYFETLPVEHIKALHLAGGRWVRSREYPESRRLLDDHLHQVPLPVFDLLREVGKQVPHPLTVILERDGNFPEIRVLLDELEQARTTLKQGRESGLLRPLKV